MFVKHVVNALLLVSFMPVGAMAAPSSPQKMAKPYAPLMIPIPGGRIDPFPTQEQIEQIANTYVFVNSHGGMLSPMNPDQGMMAFPLGKSGGTTSEGLTLNEALKKINPKFTASNYRNGSWISQNCPNEAEEAETRFPLGISCWNTSMTLTQDIGAAETTVETTAFEKREGRPDIYPFKKSTTDAEHSKSPKEYVAWLRVGEEIMRIDDIAASEDKMTFTVKRGIWGTKAVDHKRGSVVFQPVYIGSVTKGGDTALSGVPDNKSPQPGLRYGLQVHDKEFQKWLAEKCKRTFDEGYDVAWLDITESNWYNNGNAYADPVIPWNFEAKKTMTRDAFREFQQQKLDYLFSVCPGKYFWGNNMKGSSYLTNGHEQYMLSGEGGHTPMSGGSMEVYANVTRTDHWLDIVNMTLDFVKNDFWGVAWSKGGQERLVDYRLFAYCTYLLAFEPDRERPLMFGRGEGDSLLEPVEDYFYYNLGKPAKTYASVDEAKHPAGNGLYHREFENGYVIVNPSGEEKVQTLDAAMFDGQAGGEVKQVTLRPWTAAILMKAN